MSSLTDLHRAARWFSRNGFKIFPLRERGKEPLTAHGFRDASSDKAQIDEWWTQHPRANIGLPCGTANSLFALDLDYRPGNAIQSRDDLIERYGPVPETCEVETGSGRHIYFRYEGQRLPARIERGLDLKSEGGYCAVPCSVHPSGALYRFDGLSGQDSLLHLAPPPQWLLDAIARTLNTRRPAKAPERTVGEVWGDGQRNESLFAFGQRLFRAGAQGEALLAAMAAENQARCSPPLPLDEVRKVAANVGRYTTLPGTNPVQTIQPGRSVAPMPASVNLSAVEPSIDLLNSLSVFAGRLAITAVRRRGPMLIATTPRGEIVWPSADELASFSRSQARIAESTNVLIPTPPHRLIRVQWEAAASLLLRLSEADSLTLGSALAEEMRDLLHLMWRSAGQPCATSNGEFIELIRNVLRARRDPRGAVPPCVFCFEESVWVHVPTLRAWASIPTLMNRLYPLADIRNGLMLLQFTYCENTTRRFEGDAESACLWRGALEVLE